MKKCVCFMMFFWGFSLMNSQISIEKTGVDGDGLLDFKPNTNRGLLLPSTSTIPTASSSYQGAIIYDAINLKVVWCNGTTWTDATIAGTNNASFNGPISNTTSDNGNGVIIGNSTVTSVGSLTLSNVPTTSSATLPIGKALILPKVADPAANIANPIAGTMCYDTTNNKVAIFNGSQWDYWW